MKTTIRKRNGIARGIKLILLAVLLQCFVLGISIVLRANNMYPSNMVDEASAAQKHVKVQKASRHESNAVQYSAADESSPESTNDEETR